MNPVLPLRNVPNAIQYYIEKKVIITNSLRKHYGFDGVIHTDWRLVTDVNIMGRVFYARVWG